VNSISMRRGECGSARPPITRLDTSTSLEGRSARAIVQRQRRFPRLGASSSEGHNLNEQEVFAGAPPFAIFKGWGFRFNGDRNENVESESPTLAKTARMGHPRDQNLKFNFPSSARRGSLRDICLLRRG